MNELVGRQFTAMVDGHEFDSGNRGFFPTGTKRIVKLTTGEGFCVLLTEDHLVRKVVERTRYQVQYAWTAARDLKPGDEVRLHDHRQASQWSGEYTEAEGYLIGLLVGDGTIKDDKAVISAWPGTGMAVGTSETARSRCGDGNGFGRNPDPAPPQRLRRLDGSPRPG